MGSVCVQLKARVAFSNDRPSQSQHGHYKICNWTADVSFLSLARCQPEAVRLTGVGRFLSRAWHRAPSNPYRLPAIVTDNRMLDCLNSRVTALINTQARDASSDIPAHTCAWPNRGLRCASSGSSPWKVGFATCAKASKSRSRACTSFGRSIAIAHAFSAVDVIRAR